VFDGTLPGKTPSREDDRNMTKKQACYGRLKEGYRRSVARWLEKRCSFRKMAMSMVS
jgi:hypothetical protein